MKKKIVFIINPISGVGKHKGIENLIRSRIDTSVYDVEIAYTEAPGHAITIGKDAVEKGYYMAIAVGGDGSLNEVSKHLIGTDTALGIIPAGSGNGLATHLKIPLDLAKAIDIINKGRIIRIDTAIVNDLSFIGVVGVGFDAHISKEFSRYGSRGFISYVRLTIREYLGYKPLDYEMIIDGKPFKRNALLICFANSSQYGNKATIAPGATTIDGYLNVCILRKIPLLSVPLFVYHLFTRKSRTSGFMEMVRAKNIILKNPDGNLLLHIDGEPRVIKEDLYVSIKPLSIKIVVP